MINLDYTKWTLRQILLKSGKIIWATTLAAQYDYMRGEVGKIYGISADDDRTFAMLKPEVIIAGLPVYSIDQIGHAASDELLKYRSMGGIFLAHQKGGNKTFKFRARLFGPQRYIIYKILEALLYLGTEQIKLLEGNALTKMPNMSFIKGTSFIDQKSVKDISAASPLIKFVNDKGASEQEYVYHFTYPIITQTRIYTDMYMETLVLNRDVKLGKNVIEIHCAFRQYTPPTHYQLSENTVLGSETPLKKAYYRTYTSSSMMRLLRNIDSLINFSWAVKSFLYEILSFEEMRRINDAKWKTEFVNLASLYVLDTARRRLEKGV